MKLNTYSATRTASYLGYITQAIVNNLPPLLFLSFQRDFGITLGRVTLLVTLNFGIQLLTDLAAAKYVDKIGYRAAAVAAHLLCFAGLLSMGTLPFLLPNPYTGLVIATIINAIGGGLIEVIISPLVQALPSEKKSASMSLLHSFYCWGCVGVVLLSTLFFTLVGIQHWPVLLPLWAALPLANALLFTKVPIVMLPGGAHGPISLRKLFSKRMFLLLFLLMVCAGASEQAMGQWASLFAEMGLQVSKTMGDLLGPCLFAVLMGLSRVLVGLNKWNIPMEKVLFASSLLCIASYLLTVFSPFPLLSLLGCGLCGFSVGVMWPGTFSLAALRFPAGGTAMFAILALAGDLGCATGPGLVGMVSNTLQSMRAAWPLQSSLKGGLLLAIIFPILLAFGVWRIYKNPGKQIQPVEQVYSNPDTA